MKRRSIIHFLIGSLLAWAQQGPLTAQAITFSTTDEITFPVRPYDPAVLNIDDVYWYEGWGIHAHRKFFGNKVKLTAVSGKVLAINHSEMIVAASPITFSLHRVARPPFWFSPPSSGGPWPQDGQNFTIDFTGIVNAWPQLLKLNVTFAPIEQTFYSAKYEESLDDWEQYETILPYVRVVDPVLNPLPAVWPEGLVDSDHNGIADWWELHWFLKIGVNPNDQSDPDGVSLLQKFLNGATPAPRSNILTFPAISDRSVSDPPFALGASLSSGLPVNYAITSGPATLSVASGVTTLTTTGVGTVTVNAWHNGGGVYPGAGMIQRTFNVVSAAVPVITSQPQNQSYVAGMAVTFSATAIGNPAPTYQWKKNGTIIAGATNSSFTLPAIATTDAGGYTLTFINSFGQATSSVATLHVSATYADAEVTNSQARVQAIAQFQANQAVSSIVSQLQANLVVTAAGSDGAIIELAQQLADVAFVFRRTRQFDLASAAAGQAVAVVQPLLSKTQYDPARSNVLANVGLLHDPVFHLPSAARTHYQSALTAQPANPTPKERLRTMKMKPSGQ